MITTSTIPYRDGELRIGWASWDDGSYKDRSIKYAYRDSSGKISRGSPELPFDILIDMLMHADESRELERHLKKVDRQPTADAFDGMDDKALREHAKTLKTALLRLQVMAMEVRGANWGQIYDEVGEMYEQAKTELSKRRVPLVA